MLHQESLEILVSEVFLKSLTYDDAGNNNSVIYIGRYCIILASRKLNR